MGKEGAATVHAAQQHEVAFALVGGMCAAAFQKFGQAGVNFLGDVWGSGP